MKGECINTCKNSCLLLYRKLLFLSVLKILPFCPEPGFSRKVQFNSNPGHFNCCCSNSSNLGNSRTIEKSFYTSSAQFVLPKPLYFSIFQLYRVYSHILQASVIACLSLFCPILLGLGQCTLFVHNRLSIFQLLFQRS